MTHPATRPAAMIAGTLRAALNRCRAIFLRWTIFETEAYLRACARDGLTDSLALRDFRLQLASMRCRLALLKETGR